MRAPHLFMVAKQLPQELALNFAVTNHQGGKRENTDV